MVSTYVRKTERQNWTIESIEAAENGMCIRMASTTFNVPRMALKRRIIKRRAGITTQPLRSLGSFHCVFTEDQEAELLRYIFDMETRMYGLSPRDVRCLAFRLAEKNNSTHPFSVSQAAGKAWFSQFRKRHPNLSLRSPESTSVARSRGFKSRIHRQTPSCSENLQRRRDFSEQFQAIIPK
ncbi:hypothetical protein JTB14_028138 [Gonioctena quinquepunctata]|nr:hypothetical protein JTB14_028138 [Gonioctena quinquepunctata]